MTSIPIDFSAQSKLTADAFESAVRQGESCALFVPGWVLQKLIAGDRRRGAPSSGSRIRAHVLPRNRLLEIAETQELPLGDVPGGGADSVVVLARPDAETLANTPAPEMLVSYWRLLFQARIGAATAAVLESSDNAEAAAQQRIALLGRSVFNEARFVLQRERYLSFSAEDSAAYAEFAALYLTLTHFSPRALTAFFPAVADHDALRGLLDKDIASERILAGTRPPGAPDPIRPSHDAPPAPAPIRALTALARKDAGRVDRLLELARHNDTVGNDVRAGIYRMRACRTGQGNPAVIYAESRQDLDDIVRRLSAALQLDEESARSWRATLGELLDNAAGGWWNAEGRLLYDLQKVCVYHEREIYSVNVVDYCMERGRRPLKRPQPAQRLVLMTKALRSALYRIDRARVTPRTRLDLLHLIERAIESISQRLRFFLSTGIASALEHDLHPQTVTEHVARDKVVEELLDNIGERGYLRFSDVRDAISRNQVKLDDLAGPGEFFGGDQLLRIDRKLKENLDYVYHRGEIYLRGFHRLSSAFFATKIGRLITRLAILPAGGAFLILEGLDHTVGKLILHAQHGKTEAVKGLATSAAESLAPSFTETASKAAEKHQEVFAQWWMILGLAIFLMGVINIPPFRRTVARGFKYLGRGLHRVFIDLPRWIATRPMIHAIFHSRAMRAVGRYAIKPLMFAGVIWIFVPDTAPASTQVTVIAIAYISITLILNSPAGRMLEQEMLHTIRTALARFGIEILVVVGRTIMRFFQHLFEAMDRLLYAVDELLRFRAGQSKGTVVIKAILGVFWFYIAYFTRFFLNLLVEPQINPIKHFPVVTVSHKLLFPAYYPLSNVFMALGVNHARALTYATGVIWSIPGIFGFLAWEFKENWKLYRANRPKNLKPVRVGSHGESIAQFLRPGFHSGTIPKAFAKLRKTATRADSSPAASTKAQHAIAHVEHALRSFIERELLALINRHPLFASTSLHLHHLHLGATQIRIELTRATQSRSAAVHHEQLTMDHGPSPSSSSLTIVLEQRAGWILGAIAADTLTHSLSREQTALLSAGILGFYKLSAVDLVAEQVQVVAKVADSHFDLRRNDLIVWPMADFSVEASYLLSAEKTLAPCFKSAVAALPTIAPDRLFLRSNPISRAAWTLLWEPPADADSAPFDAITPLPAIQVLPASV